MCRLPVVYNVIKYAACQRPPGPLLFNKLDLTWLVITIRYTSIAYYNRVVFTYQISVVGNSVRQNTENWDGHMQNNVTKQMNSKQDKCDKYMCL